MNFMIYRLQYISSIMQGESTRALERFRANFRRERILQIFQHERQNIRFEIDLQCAITMILDISMGGEIPSYQRHQLFSIIRHLLISKSFAVKAVQEKFHQHLVVLIEKKFHVFSLNQKISLLKCTLNYLDKQDVDCRINLADRKKIFDVLIKEAGKLKLNEINQLSLLYQIVRLTIDILFHQNITQYLYLVESGWTTTIMRQIFNAQTILNHQPSQDQEELLKKIRFMALVILKKLISALKLKQEFGSMINLMKQILQDKKYLEEQPGTMLRLLAEGIIIEHFKAEILEQSEGVSQQIFKTIERIQVRCFSEQFLHNKDESLTKEQSHNFFFLLSFYVHLFNVRVSFEKTVFDWQLEIQKYLNGFMLAQFLIEASKNNQEIEILAALKTYSVLARSQFVSAEQLLAIRPADHSDRLLHIWTDPAVMKSKKGHFCLHILQKLVQSDGQYWYGRLVELGVILTLEEVINQNKSQVCPLLYKAMDLLLMLCDVNDDGRVLRMFENEELYEAINKLSLEDEGMSKRVKILHKFEKSKWKNQNITQKMRDIQKKQ